MEIPTAQSPGMQRRSSSAVPRIPPTKSMRESVRTSSMPRSDAAPIVREWTHPEIELDHWQKAGCCGNRQFPPFVVDQKTERARSIGTGFVVCSRAPKASSLSSSSADGQAVHVAQNAVVREIRSCSDGNSTDKNQLHSSDPSPPFGRRRRSSLPARHALAAR